MRILIFLLVLFVALLAYIRLAPTDVARWHRLPDMAGPGDLTEVGGFRAVRRITAPAPEVLDALQTRVLATPRTRLLAGGPGEGMMTFQTRSRLWGFPDYTTVAVNGDMLVIYGRLRFGRSDMGGQSGPC